MTQRVFIPGSQWLYFKIYTGIKTADEILTDHLRLCVDKLLEEKQIDDCFFIRYMDPDFHIRLRLHIADQNNYTAIFHEIHKLLNPLVKNGAVIKVMCDTYVREIERYGADTIELIEKLFGIDSRVIMDLLGKVSEEPVANRETIRWQLSMLLLDDTMTAFGKNMEEKNRLFARMAENFKKEFGFTSHPFTKQINDKYRRYRSDIEKGLSSREGFAAYVPLLQYRKTEIERIACEILEIRTSESESPSVDDLLSSISHMTMNRWFRVNNRAYELVIYDFLEKYFESTIARSKRMAKK